MSYWFVLQTSGVDAEETPIRATVEREDERTREATRKRDAMEGTIRIGAVIEEEEGEPGRG